ncbi:MAG: hypothetical protein JSV00_09350 [bacterium]|nr:MAG: hypothetical protein JSV00_09350 [bacterium]
MRRSRTFLLAAAMFLLPGVAAAASPSCISCHLTLGSKGSLPARMWETDTHRLAGLDCTDCHGGDPVDLEAAMAPSRGFVRNLKGERSVRLCGGCHSRPDRIPSPAIPNDQLSRLRAGAHQWTGAAESRPPTCVTCHGSHGIQSPSDPASPLFRTRVADLCLACHGTAVPDGPSPPGLFPAGVHGKALTGGTNPGAATCTDCHGAHRVLVPAMRDIPRLCGTCHTREYQYFVKGPHGLSLALAGEPSCTHCHDPHATLAAGLVEIAGKISEGCSRCHQPASGPWRMGYDIDEGLLETMESLESLRDLSGQLTLTGIHTGSLTALTREALSWLVEVESALHSVGPDWEELTGMAKVKMMAAWGLSRDYMLERRIRRSSFLVVAMLAFAVLALLARWLRLVERDQHRRHLLGSPEARQKEQERHRP